MNPKLVNYITKKWDCVVAGLEYRGFGPFDGSECSKGRCSTPDRKHFILFTDGMIIYSNIPDHDQARYYDEAVVYEWLRVEDFEFSVLDKIMSEGISQMTNCEFEELKMHLKKVWDTMPVIACDDERIMLSFDNNEHHFEIEILKDGPTEFFYRNRNTEEYWGAE